jgi:hypothetical protein
MSYVTTRAESRETVSAKLSAVYSGRVSPQFMVFSVGKWVGSVVPESWEILDTAKNSVTMFGTWRECATALALLRYDRRNPHIVYGIIDGQRKAFSAVGPFGARGARLDKDDMNNFAQPSLALGELPLGKFSKARGVFAAVRVWSAP